MFKPKLSCDQPLAVNDHSPNLSKEEYGRLVKWVANASLLGTI